MTDGTSQGLFIVVAIVIFGIFTVMAYILFEDTLSPSLANMFSDATEKSQESLKHGRLLHRDREFERISELGLTYTGRGGVKSYLDVVNTFNDLNTMRIDFVRASDGASLVDDFIVWLPEHLVEDIVEGDVIEVSFYAKADKDVDLGLRLGDRHYGDGSTVAQKITSEWQLYKVPLTVKGHRSGGDRRSAVVMWVYEASDVWFSELEVRLFKQ